LEQLFPRMFCAESWGSLLREKGCWKKILTTETSKPPLSHITWSFVKIYTSWTSWAWRWRHSSPSKGRIYLPVDKQVSEVCSDVLGHLVGYKSFHAKHRVLHKPARDFLQTFQQGGFRKRWGGVGIFLTASLYHYVHLLSEWTQRLEYDTFNCLLLYLGCFWPSCRCNKYINTKVFFSIYVVNDEQTRPKKVVDDGWIYSVLKVVFSLAINTDIDQLRQQEDDTKIFSLDSVQKGWQWIHRGADKSLARPTSRCILFDGENISFEAIFIYIYIYIYV
jgi:hypothetical protein